MEILLVAEVTIAAAEEHGCAVPVLDALTLFIAPSSDNTNMATLEQNITMYVRISVETLSVIQLYMMRLNETQNITAASFHQVKTNKRQITNTP